MKRKRIIVFFIISVLSINALYLSAFALYWFTPYDGTVIVNRYSYPTNTTFQATNLKWSSSSINNYIAAREDYTARIPYWELEARKVGMETYYSSKGTINTNLPSSYCELDDDDFSIGCAACHNLSSSTTYYATQTLPPTSSVSSFVGYELESEWGSFELYDGFPLNYETLNSYISVNSTWSW